MSVDEALRAEIEAVRTRLSNDSRYQALREFANRYEDCVPSTVEWVKENYPAYTEMEANLLEYERPLKDLECKLASCD